MLDKDTITRQVMYDTSMNLAEEVNKKPRKDQTIDPFMECVDRARNHVEDEKVRECFDKAQKLKKDS